MRNFTAVPNDVLPMLAKLHGCAISVYVALRSYADRQGECFPKLDDIASRSGCSTATVKRVMKKIKNAGLVTDKQRNSHSGRTSNLYVFLDPPRLSVTPGENGQGSQRSLPGFPESLPTAHTDHAVTRTTQQEPHNKNQSARKCVVDDRLLELAKAWNELGAAIAPAVKLDPLPKAVREGWKKVHADPEVRAVFDNIPALMKAIRAATFCHGKGYFTLAWIFTRDRQTKELRAAKILAGAYADPKAKLLPDRFFFNPERPIDEKF